ncbi:MAG: hypothetical protein HW421_3233 [Ignavibacteria bacterium]|nr:hypothetical protein [Ignavibacteria bacterium]
MKVEFIKKFKKDLIALKGSGIGKDVTEIINQVKTAEKLSDIKDMKKLQGHDNAFRIKVNDYRIGVFITNDEVTFSRVKHRKDIYRKFP